MEDSGFDSGDRVVNFMVRKTRKFISQHKNMVLKFFCLQQNYQNHSDKINLGSESSTSNEEEILHVKHMKKSMPSIGDNIDNVAFRNPSLINPTTATQVLIDQSKSHHLNEHNKKLSNINQCKSLHRKLEQKVERAKKNFLHNEKFNQLENDAVSFSSFHSLSHENRRYECHPQVTYFSIT